MFDPNAVPRNRTCEKLAMKIMPAKKGERKGSGRGQCLQPERWEEVSSIDKTPAIKQKEYLHSRVIRYRTLYHSADDCADAQWK
jgi:hypothetical protein